jgi:DNA topoisomerase-1
VRILSGRYGPYIKHGATNANVPRGSDPQELTLEQAVALLTERETKGGGGKGGRAKKPARARSAPSEAKAPAAKKPAAKKPAAKKAAPKKSAAKKSA